MSQPTFAQIWSEKVRSIRQSDFWSTVSQPVGTPLVRPTVVPSVDQIMVDDGWGIAVEGDASHDGPARNGVAKDLATRGMEGENDRTDYPIVAD